MSAACRRCLLPETLPGTAIGEDGLCATCRETPDAAALAEGRRALRATLAATIERLRGARPYEVVVAFSGGKDSSFTLAHLVRDLGLRCLAVTIDNGFLSEGTFANCRAVCGTLGVDHVMFTPSRRFTTRMYRASVEREDLHPPAAIRRASAICSSCITLINTHVLQKAAEVGAPMVAGGYLAGQLPRDGALMVVRPGIGGAGRTAAIKRFVDALGEEARTYLEVQAVDTPPITIVNPMLGIDLSDDEVMAAIAPLGWRKPHDTGVTSTNCRLNDLGVYLHARRHGFHPYALEIAEQLRHGTLDRAGAERKLGALPSREEVAWLAERLGMDLHAGER